MIAIRLLTVVFTVVDVYVSREYLMSAERKFHDEEKKNVHKKFVERKILESQSRLKIIEVSSYVSTNIFLFLSVDIFTNN